MADELFVAVCSLFTMILFRWSFHHLPQEKWQFLAAVPTCKGSDNCWQGINLTYYGFFNATAYTLACMLVIFLTAAAGIPIGYTLALLVIIGVEPWYQPQYLIPLLGMLLGNTMTGIAVSLDSLTRQTIDKRHQIEARLALGHTAAEAIGDIRRDALRAGLIPIVNAMATAGIVSLPGMMTGQILAGSPPMEAAKYQLMILCLIATGTGLGSISAVMLASRRLFDRRERFCRDRLRL